MNTAIVSGLTLLAASMSLSLPAVSAGACSPHVVQGDTKFPSGSQMRGQQGTVYINVVIDESGRARSASLQRSSGYRKLDRAATESAMGDWLFDVSGCERKDLPANHVVAVEYRNEEY